MDVSTGYFLAEMGANYLNLWLSGETLSNPPFDFEDFDGETHGDMVRSLKLSGHFRGTTIFVGEIPVCQKHPHVVVGPEHGTCRTMWVEGIFFCN